MENYKDQMKNKAEADKLRYRAVMLLLESEQMSAKTILGNISPQLELCGVSVGLFDIDAVKDIISHHIQEIDKFLNDKENSYEEVIE